ncbi:tripartite motif containing 101 isoform 2-T2 [Symphorus nematophorus]
MERKPSLFQARTTMMVSSGRFRCPSCRHDVVLDRHGVYGLQRNLLVENIIDIYKQEVSNNNNNSATSPAPPPPPAAQVTCSDHEGEKVNIYCLTCQVPTCSLCKVFGAHQSCQVAPLSDVYQQQKEKLSKEVTSLVAFNDKVQTLINEVEETCRNIEENCKTQKQSVCEMFDRVFSILEERRKAMTQRISSEQEEKTSHVQALVRCYGDSVEANSKLVERATSSMEEPDMAAFVQNSRELITKVITATSSCPTETLKPGYESMSHYRYDFSRQERALRSIDFLKPVEDVPEEPEVEQEPEEPKESKHHQDISAQDLESVVEPVKEPIPALISPPVEPVQTAASVPPAAPGPVRDSVEPAGAVLQPETENLNDGGSDQMKNKTEEEEMEAPEPVKEGNICEHQEGMSTQQCEGGEAESDAGDRTTQSETEEKHDAQDEDGEEMQMKEEIDATLYPSWYKPNSRCRFNSAPADTEQTMRSPPPAQGADVSELHTQPRPSCGLDSHPKQPQPYPPLPRLPHQSENQSPPLCLLQESQTVPAELDDVFTPAPPQLTVQGTAGGAGITEEENEEEEEEEVDIQGWVCVPGAVDKSFSLAEGSFDLGEGSSESFPDNNDSPSSAPPEETHSGLEKGHSDEFELSDGRLEEKDGEEQHDEDSLEVKCVSEVKERGLGGDFEGGAMNERLGKGIKVQVNDLSGLEKDAVSIRGDCSETKSSILEKRKSKMEGDGDTEFEPGSSGFAENTEEDGGTEDFNTKMETSAAESEEKITSSVSSQAVTLLFYLLAFLLILQRVWAYIGCFICT